MASPHPLRFFFLLLLISLSGCVDYDARDFDDYLEEMQSRGLYDPLDDPYYDDSDLPPSIDPTLCSLRDAGPAREILFENATNASLDLFWVNSECVLQPYATIAPGQGFVQPTYEGHAWRLMITGTTRTVFEILISPTSPNFVVVEAQN